MEEGVSEKGAWRREKKEEEEEEEEREKDDAKIVR